MFCGKITVFSNNKVFSKAKKQQGESLKDDKCQDLTV